MVKRIALVVGLVAASVLFGGGVAGAGGPTSVLLSSPSTERTTALRYSHPTYNLLDVLLHNGASVPEPAGGGGNVVTATWLIHDVQVWRIDRIHLEAPGGPLVGTQEVSFGEPLPPGLTPGATSEPTISWRRVNDGAQVRALLTEVGVVGPTPPAGTAAILPATAPAPAPAPAPADTFTGWWWGTVGLVGGIGATLLVTRRRPRATTDLDEPALVVQDRT